MASVEQHPEVDSEQADPHREVLGLLGRLQVRLREGLLAELWEDRDVIDGVAGDLDLYSYKFQSYKERYLDKLADLQRIINELMALEKQKAAQRK